MIRMPIQNHRFKVNFEIDGASIATEVSEQIVSVDLPMIVGASMSEPNLFALKPDLHVLRLEIEDDAYGITSLAVYKHLMNGRSFETMVHFFSGESANGSVETFTFKGSQVKSILYDQLTYKTVLDDRYMLKLPASLTEEPKEIENLRKMIEKTELVKLNTVRPATKRVEIRFTGILHRIKSVS